MYSSQHPLQTPLGKTCFHRASGFAHSLVCAHTHIHTIFTLNIQCQAFPGILKILLFLPLGWQVSKNGADIPGQNGGQFRSRQSPISSRDTRQDARTTPPLCPEAKSSPRRWGVLCMHYSQVPQDWPPAVLHPGGAVWRQRLAWGPIPQSPPFHLLCHCQMDFAFCFLKKQSSKNILNTGNWIC